MPDYVNIAVFHPATVSDTLMATPVASVLRQNLPAAKITWLSDPKLSKLLLSFCLSIDEVLEVPRDASLLKQMAAINSIKPDLLVTLSPSLPGKILSWFSGTKLLARQVVPASDSRNHLVEDFILTLAPLHPIIPENVFPTLHPQALTEETLSRLHETTALGNKEMIAMVPGVGNMMSQRAWFAEGWEYLIRHVLAHQSCTIVLIGTEEDAGICQEINAAVDNACLDLSGQLPLTEAAALLKQCRLVISGDCGMLHLAVAVGAPVVGLYGATAAERRGPYGPGHRVIDQSDRCNCEPTPTCYNLGVRGPGECMRRIMLEEVIATVHSALGLPMPTE